MLSQILLSLTRAVWYLPHFLFTLIMSTNSGFNDAPPTRNPSTSSWVAIQIKAHSGHLRILKDGNTRTEFLAVRCSDRAPIDDPGCFRHALGHLCLQELTDLGVRFLRLCRSSDFARADRPHRLVRDHDVATVWILGSCWGSGTWRRGTYLQ